MTKTFQIKREKAKRFKRPVLTFDGKLVDILGIKFTVRVKIITILHYSSDYTEIFA